MNHPETIIVTLTSWHKRIGNVARALTNILSQSLVPDKILLNLCTEDFPNMEKDLPVDLLNIVNSNESIEIYWFIENYKAWKKHLHALDIAKDDDIIISVDDDINYPLDYIEKLYVSYCYYDKKFPITSTSNSLFHNLWTFGGGGMLYQKKFWGKDYKKYLTNKVLHNAYEDIIINTIFAINDVLILPQMFDIPNFSELTIGDNDPFSDISKSSSREGVQNMMANTLIAMEDAIDNHYFEKDHKFNITPHFWEILRKCVDNNKHYADIYPAAKIAIDTFYQRFLKAEIVKVDREKNRLSLKRLSKEDLIGPWNRVIVTLSSWNKRIQNVAPVLKSIIYNTISPDVIYLNLACADFNMDIKTANSSTVRGILHYFPEFPIELIELIETSLNDSSAVPIYINWYDDSELKSWKKHLRVIADLTTYNRLNDVIFSIDDDVIYKSTYIETMLKSYNLYGRKYPITCFSNCFCQGGYPFCGYGMLYTAGFFKNINNYLNAEIVHKFPEDNHLLNILNVNNCPVLPVIGRNYLFADSNFNEENSNFGNLVFDEKWWNSYNDIIKESEKILTEKCQGRPELSAGWRPIYFNFSIANLANFLKENEYRRNEDMFKYIYDAVECHLNNNPGAGEDLYKLASRIDDIIL